MAPLFGGVELVRLESLAIVLDRRDDLLVVVSQNHLGVGRARVLPDVAQTLADDPNDGALDEGLERTLHAGLLEVHRDSALPAEVVREARDGHRQVQPAGLFGLPQCRHVLPHIGERRPRVPRGFRELGPERRWIAIERALAALERKDDAGELLGDTVMQLL